MEYIKGFVKGYDEVIYKILMAVIWFCIGGITGYAIGVYKVFDMVMK